MKLSCLGKEMFIKKLYQLYFSSEVQQYLQVLSCLKVSSLIFAIIGGNGLYGHSTTVLGIHCEFKEKNIIIFILPVYEVFAFNKHTFY